MSIRDIFPFDKWDFQSQSVLADLPKEEYEQLMLHKTEKLYRKAEIIFGKEPTQKLLFLLYLEK